MRLPRPVTLGTIHTFSPLISQPDCIRASDPHSTPCLIAGDWSSAALPAVVIVHNAFAASEQLDDTAPGGGYDPAWGGLDSGRNPKWGAAGKHAPPESPISHIFPHSQNRGRFAALQGSGAFVERVVCCLMAGTTYVLTFAAANRPGHGDDESLVVTLDGQVK